MRRMMLTVLALAPLAAPATGQSASVTKHTASWLASARGNLFFCLSADGSQVLVNRSPSSAKEELVVVPAAGGEGVVWHAAPGRSIYDRIALSGDGKSVVWVDDVRKGPLIADADGKNLHRIAVAPDRLGRVICNATASVVYFEAFDRNGSHLWRVNRNGTGATKLHSTASGRFFVARGSGQVRLERFDPKATPPGSSWLMTGTSPTKMFDLGRPDVVGTSAWSDNGKVFVWRSPVSPGVWQTLVWRARG